MIDTEIEENQKSRRPETNGTTMKPQIESLRESPREENRSNPVHIPVSVVEQVRIDETNCFANKSTTTCTSLRIWLG